MSVQRTLQWAVDTGAVDFARILRGWTRRDLAQEAICDLFAGRRRPTFGTLRALCQVLELTLEDMIRFSG